MAEPLLRFRSVLEVSEVLINGDRRYLLVDPLTEVELRLGVLEYKIAILYDGTRTVAEVAELIHKQARVKHNVEAVRKLTERLVHFRIVEIPGQKQNTLNVSPFTGMEVKGPLQRLLAIKLVELRGDRWLVWLLKKAPFLGTLWFFCLCLTVIFVGAALLVANWQRFFHDLVRVDIQSWRFWIVLFLLGNLVTAVHECGHAIACRAQGIRVLSVGFILHFFTVAAWTRPGREWRRLPASGRAVTVLAGPVTSFVFTGIAILIWRLTLPSNPGHETAMIFVLASSIGSIITLVPLHSGDGYVLITDLLGIGDLRQRSFAYLKYLATGQKPPQLYKVPAWLFGVFGVCVVIWRVVLIATVFYCMSFVPIRVSAWHIFTLVICVLLFFGGSIFEVLMGLVRYLRDEAESWMKGQPTRRSAVLGLVMAFTCLPVPMNLTAACTLKGDSIAHAEIDDPIISELAIGDAARVQFDDDPYSIHHATVKTLHFERSDEKDVFAADMLVDGEQLRLGSSGISTIRLGWAPLAWALARPHVGRLMPRLWSWL